MIQYFKDLFCFGGTSLGALPYSKDLCAAGHQLYRSKYSITTNDVIKVGTCRQNWALILTIYRNSA